MHALCSNCRGEFAKHVALRPHLARAPVGQIRLVHRKAVMMLGDRHDVARAGIVKELRPCSRIKVFGGEFGNQVLVAELCLWTVCGDVVREVRRALLVHVP